jgi:diguanylate cyclase (GGDEF)-like protein
MIAPRRRLPTGIGPSLRAPARLAARRWAPIAAASGLAAATIVGAVVGGIRFDLPWGAGILLAAAALLAGAAALTVRRDPRRTGARPNRPLLPAGVEELRIAAIERVLGAVGELLPSTRALVVRFREDGVEGVALADGGALRTGAELGALTQSPLADLVRRHGRVALLAPCPASEVAMAFGMRVPPDSARSLVWIPLPVGGSLAGALCLTSDEPDGLSTDQSETFRAIGVMVGAALDAHGALDAAPPDDGRDGITGLLARGAFVDRLGDLMGSAGRRRTSLCLAAMVLDDFPSEVDAPGQRAGERLLRAVAAALAGQLRGDDMLARSGAREFAVAFTGSDLTGAGALARRLRRSLPPGATASIGIAAWRPSERPEELLRRAEHALAEARRAGRDQVSIAPQ